MKLFAAAAFLFATTASVNAESIVEIAAGNDNFSTLVELVQLAGLVPALDGSSGTSVTVFAPTNEAFDTLPEELVSNLQEPEWITHLTSVLKTHVLGSVVPSSAITEDMMVETLSGEMVDITADPITVDGAGVAIPDIEADNGIIHAIDGVITPSWIDKDLPQAASDVPMVSTLVQLLGSADLVGALSAGEGPFTVFAPTNDAFQALDPEVVSCVTDNSQWLTATLLYHVLEAGTLVSSVDVATGSVPTLEGSDLSVDAGDLTVNGVPISGPDALLANNGVAHLIDGVLLPPTIEADVMACVEGSKMMDPTASPTDAPVMTPPVSDLPTIAEIGAADQNFSIVVALLQQAGLLSAVDGSSGMDVTLFAPTNDAFGTLDAEFVAALQDPMWIAHLTSVLTTHVLDSVVQSSDITNDMSVKMLSGEMVDVTADPITIDGVTVNVDMVDIEASNGVVHVIDGVITPAWVEKTLPQAASDVPQVSKLVELLGSAELVDALSEAGPFTVFAPTNDAFEALDPAVTSCVTGNSEWLTATLLYHVLESGTLVSSSDVATGSVPTLGGTSLAVEADDLTVGSANIIGPDALLANNGVAHLIDAVLLPPSIEADVMACVDDAKMMEPTAAPVKATAAPTDEPEMDQDSGSVPSTISVAGLAVALVAALLV